MSDPAPDPPGLPPPPVNPELVGQEAAEASFLEAWHSGRMPHAWLLHGPAGIGKATLAYRVARFVLSGGDAGEAGEGLFGPAAAPAPARSLAVDPESRIFRLVASGGHPDLRVLKRGLTARGDRLSSEITVAVVREFEAALRLKSKEGGWRVAIVDEAERLNRNAENALLKILEEPPVNTLILLISDRLNSLLPTTRSRCRRMSMPTLPEPLIGRLLARARPDLPAADAGLVTRLAEGSIGRAVALVDAGGAGLYRKVAGLMAGLPAIDGEASHGLASDWSRRPKEGEADRFATGMQLMALWVDRAIRIANGAPGLTAFETGDLDAGARYVRTVGTEAAFRRREEMVRLIRLEPALNLDRKQVMLDCLHVLAFGDGLDRRPLAE